jgi:hypothetical protein
MKTFVRVFTSSTLFTVVILLVYAYMAKVEAAGTLLLGIMVIGLLFAMGYAIFAEKDANLEGDYEHTKMEEWTGDDLGVYTPESAWPFLTAVSVVFALLGLLWAPVVSAFAVVALLLCLWRLGEESMRHD